VLAIKCIVFVVFFLCDCAYDNSRMSLCTLMEFDMNTCLHNCNNSSEFESCTSQVALKADFVHVYHCNMWPKN